MGLGVLAGLFAPKLLAEPSEPSSPMLVDSVAFAKEKGSETKQVWMTMGVTLDSAVKYEFGYVRQGSRVDAYARVAPGKWTLLSSHEVSDAPDGKESASMRPSVIFGRSPS
jgi:hypothetical protein